MSLHNFGIHLTFHKKSYSNRARYTIYFNTITKKKHLCYDLRVLKVIEFKWESQDEIMAEFLSTPPRASPLLSASPASQSPGFGHRCSSVGVDMHEREIDPEIQR